MFNKWTDQKLEFPLTEEALENLNPCRLVNPTVWKYNGLKIPEDFNLEESTEEILEVREMVKAGIFPREFMEKYYPFKWEFPSIIPKPLMAEALHLQNPEWLANIVHMDLPSQAPSAILRYLLQSWANVKDWTPNYINFLESVPYVQENMTDGIKLWLNKAFEAKYYFWLQRPEEIAKQWKFMTAYPEWCPNHPSFPAGHWAAVAWWSRRVIESFEKLTDEQLKQVLDTVYIWAMARSLAWVHHAIDNVAWIIVWWLDKYMRDDVLKSYKN